MRLTLLHALKKTATSLQDLWYDVTSVCGLGRSQMPHVAIGVQYHTCCILYRGKKGVEVHGQSRNETLSRDNTTDCCTVLVGNYTEHQTYSSTTYIVQYVVTRYPYCS
jgi:hypothetical protein